MAFEITTTDVWAGHVAETPGALADKLEAIQRAGGNLEFAIVRPCASVTSGNSLMFVAPVTGERQAQAALEVGLSRGLHALRVAIPDRPGLIAEVTRTLGDAGIAISGLWAAVLRGHAVLYLMLESGAETRRAAKVLSVKLS
ncbi:MAG: hypothetical protein AB1716_03230 [Planctomycetota bacterium]